MSRIGCESVDVRSTVAGVVVSEDRYSLAGIIGRGGMGEVYEAHDRMLDRSVAVKVLRAGLVRDEAARRRFRAEARAATRLIHPNVVTVYDVDEYAGSPCIVMERLPGRTLADLIRDASLAADTVRQIAVDLVTALAAAHRAGIVHRDVKPGNVLQAADGSWKVADFGIAKLAGDDVTVTAEILGTPAYLAPERVGGAPATPASDVYSAGVVLYEAAAGARPFTGDTPWALMHAITRGDFLSVEERRPGFDVHLAAVIGRAMQRRPEDRYPDADDMLRALRGEPAYAPARAAGHAAKVPTAPLETRTARLTDRRPAGPSPDDTAVQDAPSYAGHGEAPSAPRRSRSWRWWLLGTGALLALLLVLTALDDGTNGRSAVQPEGSPTTVEAESPATSARTLPSPLDDTLDQLDKALER